MILGEALKYASDFKILEFKAPKLRSDHRKKEATKSLAMFHGKRLPIQRRHDDKLWTNTSFDNPFPICVKGYFQCK